MKFKVFLILVLLSSFFANKAYSFEDSTSQKGWIVFFSTSIIFFPTSNITVKNEDFFKENHLNGFRLIGVESAGSMYLISKGYAIQNVMINKDVSFNMKSEELFRIAPAIITYSNKRDNIYKAEVKSIEFSTGKNRVNLEYLNYWDHSNIVAKPLYRKDERKLRRKKKVKHIDFPING